MLSTASEPLLNQRELLTKTFSRCSGFIFLVSEETNKDKKSFFTKKGYWKNLINILFIIIKADQQKGQQLLPICNKVS